MKALINFLRRVFDLYSGSRLHRKNKITASRVIAKLGRIKGDHQQAQRMKYLKKINPYVFEELLLTALQNAGHRIKRGRKYSGDGGIDGIVYKNGRQVFVQAKRYQDHIKPEHVRNFIRLTTDRNTNGLFIHTGKTSADVFNLVKWTRVEIISGDRLLSLILNEAA